MSSAVARTRTTEKAPAGSGSHERSLAAGAAAQQVTLVTSTITMFLVFTLMAHTLSLGELGAYGLLISLPTYLLFAQGTVESAAVRSIAQARDQFDRDRAFTTALCLYTLYGVIAALLIALGGTALLNAVTITPGLHEQARLSILGLAVVNLIGLPVKTALDSVRACGRFVLAAAAEALAYVTFGALMLVALLVSAPLWMLVVLGGSLSLLIGLWALAALILVRIPIRPRLSTLSLSYTRAFASMSLLLLVSSVGDLVTYSLDRTILGLFRPVATVGLYEGPIRAHNLLRTVQAALVMTVMASAAGYVAVQDRLRLRELLLRGTRYVAIMMMPFTILLMTLSGPILQVWLGPHFAPAAGAMTIFVSYWLVLGGGSVGVGMLIAAGRMRTLAIYSTVGALLNLGISLALTPSLGLDGVVLGTSLPGFVMGPVFACIVCRAFAVPVVTYVREGLAVAYTAGALLAGAELLARALLPLQRPALLIGMIALGLSGYAIGVYRLGLSPRERLLARTTLKGARSWVASLPASIASLAPARWS
jgi:O-antigen/teichoic acid export membrane protein